MTFPPVPVTVLGGYLGAGKTTLVNHLLRQAAGRRILVLVNDFGALPIDADLIAARDGDLVTLANGCACCQVGQDLLGALAAALAAGPRPDHLLIEASGVADPARLADLARADPALSLDAVLVMVDAAAIRRQASDRWAGATVAAQLRSAGLVVLNKIDLVPPTEIETVRAWLTAMAPRAAVIEATRATVHLDVALGPIGWNRTGPLLTPIDHAAAYASWSGMLDAGLPRERARALLSALPPWVYRAKGRSTDPDTGIGFAFHRAGEQVEIEALAAGTMAPAGTMMVAIGPRASFVPATLDAALADMLSA